MPTFETEVPAKPVAIDKTDEFRPKKRGERRGTLDETFDPSPIPPEVKQAIDKRINDIMRQSSGPDETMYSIRGWFSTAKKIILNLPTIVKDVILHRNTEAENGDDDEIEEEEEAEEESENNSSDASQRPAPTSGEAHRRHGSHRGGRKHYNRGDRDSGRDYKGRRDDN